MNDQVADLTSQRVEGWTNEGGIPFSVPLFSHIDGFLWMGGSPVYHAPTQFKFIIDVYTGEAYKAAKHQVYLAATLFDSHDAPDPDTLRAIVAHINVCRNLGPTLVHCQAGLNRSGLLCALALKASGMDGKAAIALLREKRCAAVLCNRTFEAMVLGPAPQLEWPA